MRGRREGGDDLGGRKGKRKREYEIWGDKERFEADGGEEEVLKKRSRRRRGRGASRVENKEEGRKR